MKFFVHARSIFTYLFLLAVFVGLQACSGGGDSTPVIADANPTGYYIGSATVKEPADNNVDYSISDIQIMISGTRIMIMSDSRAVLYDGTFTVSGNDLTSTVTIYYNGDKQAATATLNATITEGSQLTGSFTGTNLGNGTFVSTFSSLSNTASDFSNLYFNPGSSWWRTNSLNLEVGRNFEFEVTNISGDFTDSTNDSQLSLIACRPNTGSNFSQIANTSFFAVSMTLTHCTANAGNANSATTGVYTGFAQFKDAGGNKLAFTVSNGTYAIADDVYEN